MIALALAWLALGGTAVQDDLWSVLWAEIETLRAGNASPAEAGALRAHLDEAARDAPDGPRTTLLRATLEGLDGRDASGAALRLAAMEPTPFTPRELWYLAELLPSGAERARVILAAFAAEEALARWQALLAWNTAVDEARALRLEQSALPIQRALYARFADPSSASDLALTLKALGRTDEAERLLGDAVARAAAAGQRPADLWESRGINALGSGDESRARDYLGRALAYGSEGAALLLARLDLLDGRVGAARQGFRALILRTPPPDWAWRGWGAALLPVPHAPARIQHSNE